MLKRYRLLLLVGLTTTLAVASPQATPQRTPPTTATVTPLRDRITSTVTTTTVSSAKQPLPNPSSIDAKKKPFNKRNPTIQRKKIVILTSKGGYGHMAACATLQKTFPNCDIVLVNPIELAFGFVKKLLLNKVDGEEAYNSAIGSGWVRTANFLVRHPAIWFFYELRPKIERKLYNILRSEKADLLISVVPFVNRPAGDAALRCHIPFLLITLDADLTNWLYAIEKCKHHEMLITVGRKTARITKQLAMHKIKPDIVKEVGFTIRPDFFEPKNKIALKKAWNVPADKPVVLIMMGGAGSQQLINFTKELSTFDRPLHLLICVGRNTAIIKKINKIKHNDKVSIQPVPFTTKVSELLAMTDVMITKPGPNSCYEAMVAGVPLLIDMTTNSLFWERGTVDIVNQYGRGTVVKKMKETKGLVKKYLTEKRPTVNKFRSLPRFEDEIKPIVYDMLTRAPLQPTLTMPSNVKAPNGNIVKPAKAGQGNPKVSAPITQKR
jgi:processive 1,2-diacylglycerol beta-glucosyltransferase